MGLLNDAWDMSDDILVVVGAVIAVFTSFFEEGLLIFLVGLALMWAKGEI